MISRAKNNFGAAINLTAFYFIFSVSVVLGAVSFDSASSGAAFSNTGVSSLTWQHTVTTTGTEKALFVSVSTTTDPILPGSPVCTTQPLLCNSASLPGTASARVVSVTYNGDPMQAVGFQVSADLKQAVEIYRLVAPDEGMPYNVVVTLNPASVFQVVGGSTSFTGVSQTTPNGSFNSASGTNNMPTVTVGDAVVGDIVLDALAIPPNALNAVVGANQTERYNGRTSFNNTYDLGAGSTEPGTAATETMSWQTTNSDNWAIAAIAVKQSVVSAASVTVGGRVLTATGKGIARARVMLTNSKGETRTALTNYSGYFNFQDVMAGETYIFNVSSKLYTFNPQAVTINDEITGLKFIAE
jgi:hypothetical protein